MRITKLGHCCLLIEVKGKRILTDPGLFTVEQHSELVDIDTILITHEHADHCHSESVQQVLATNPQAEVLCNQSVGKLLVACGVETTCLEGEASVERDGVMLQAFDCQHAEIYQSFGQVQATGYLVDERLFLPADSWDVPPFVVDTLALPVSGPWCKIADAVDYATAVAPRQAFPVHDGLLTEQGRDITITHPARELRKNDITFHALAVGEVLTVSS